MIYIYIYIYIQLNNPACWVITKIAVKPACLFNPELAPCVCVPDSVS